MNKTNFFTVNRGLLNSDRWLGEPFTRGQAWIDLFGLAQYAKGFFRIRGIRVEVERGQLAYSQLTLAKRWHWSRNKVRRYLIELEKDGDIEQQNNEVTTLITIVNYDEWQLNDTTNDTTERQQKDNRRTTEGTHNNKINNINKINNVLSSIEEIEKVRKEEKLFEIESLEMELVNLLCEEMRKNNPKVKLPNLQKWAGDVDKMMRIDSRSEEEIKFLILWSQQDSFWKANILSMGKLREKFDQLMIKAKSDWEAKQKNKILSF